MGVSLSQPFRQCPACAKNKTWDGAIQVQRRGISAGYKSSLAFLLWRRGRQTLPTIYIYCPSKNILTVPRVLTRLRRDTTLAFLRPTITMPPKRASSGSTKRKASEDDASSSKRAKTGEFTPANGQPNNKTLPVSISFPAKTDGALRIAAWNICGLAASQKKVCCLSESLWVMSVLRMLRDSNSTSKQRTPTCSS